VRYILLRDTLKRLVNFRQEIIVFEILQQTQKRRLIGENCFEVQIRKSFYFLILTKGGAMEISHLG